MTHSIVNLKAAPIATEASQPRVRFNIRAPIVEVSTVIAAVFAIMTYVGQDKTDATLADIKANTARNTQIAADALEQNVAQLKLLSRMLPEAERTRLGIEKLIDNGEKQLKALRAQPSGKGSEPVKPAADRAPERRDDRGPEQRKPQVGGWTSLGSPEHPLNKKAKEIWKSVSN
jgi:hypothetical protein